MRIVILIIVGIALAVLLWSFLARPEAQGFEVQSSASTQAADLTATAGGEGASQSVSSQTDSSSPAVADELEAKSSPITVYISGAVPLPGVYQLPADARVDDGVRAAGGLSEDAAGEYVNLAALLLDGQQVHIPTREEIDAGSVPTGITNPSITQPATGAAPAGSSAVTAPVNINTADAATLDTLPGIGPATAQRIISYREAHGAFSSIEELKQVSGIGEKKYEALRDLICV
ncbi:MAG: ComEA family DNA-binding protein [Coriobacteriales bacterium]|nr:ComEA family DNA-binding protein [Coriobacteriales bacterium]